MVPRCDVDHVLARADVSFGVNHLALGFAVTFPERSFGGEQVLRGAYLHVFCGDIIEENAGFGDAGGLCDARRCRGRNSC